jgi:hypothetical protein
MFIQDGEDRTCAERDNRSEAHASPFPLLHIFINFSPSRTLLALLFALYFSLALLLYFPRVFLRVPYIYIYIIYSSMSARRVDSNFKLALSAACSGYG